MKTPVLASGPLGIEDAKGNRFAAVATTEYRDRIVACVNACRNIPTENIPPYFDWLLSRTFERAAKADKMVLELMADKAALERTIDALTTVDELHELACRTDGEDGRMLLTQWRRRVES